MYASFIYGFVRWCKDTKTKYITKTKRKMIRNYIQSPLPFQGQKRNFLKQFKEGLQEFDKSTIFVDLFGGSGLLSHCIKQQSPNARVVYNDYDNFSERLKMSIRLMLYLPTLEVY